MPSILTLDGARQRPPVSLLGLARGLADEWSNDTTAPGESVLGKATWSFLGWGFVAFGLGTAGLRAWDATFGKRGGGDVRGARPRRRRGR